MRHLVRRLVCFQIILCLGWYAGSRLVAQDQEVEVCCACGEPQFDLECNATCSYPPYCECGEAQCSSDGMSWICPERPFCADGYQPVCGDYDWFCEWAGDSGDDGWYYCAYCPYWDPYCDYCPWWDPCCEYCDYEWDSSCYGCDECDPYCGAYAGEWYCIE